MSDPRLAKLAQYLAKTDHGMSLEDFWTGWDTIAGDDADHALCEAYMDLLASADDGGGCWPDRGSGPVIRGYERATSDPMQTFAYAGASERLKRLHRRIDIRDQAFRLLSQLSVETA